MRPLSPIPFVAFILIAAPLPAQSREPPTVRVENVRRAFHNGEHNAFTDLVRFKDRLYLTFRSCPDGHMVHPGSSIIVLSSGDGEDWMPVHRFSVAKRDTRDPHFLVFRDRLFVYAGTWYHGDESPRPETYEMNDHLGYAAWTGNGRDWEGPQLMEGTHGHYIWRAATHDDTAFLCGRRKRDFARFDSRTAARPSVQSVMLESDDGLAWRTRAFFQEEWGDETAFLFEPDGRVLAVARSSTRPAQLCRSEPPYTKWRRQDLDRFIGGPLVVKWQGHIMVGGRKTGTGDGPKTVLSWLIDGKLHDFAELPSGGDNSYPGFVELNNNRALISWYSSHEQGPDETPITAIYLAELVVN